MKPLLVWLSCLCLSLTASALTAEEFKTSLESLNFKRIGNGATPVNYQKVANLPGPSHTQLVPVFNSTELTITLQYDSAVETAPGLLVKDLCLLSALSGELEHPKDDNDPFWRQLVLSAASDTFGWAELTQNAQNGDLIAAARLRKIEYGAYYYNAAKATNFIKSAFGSASFSPGQEIISSEVLEKVSLAADEKAKLYGKNIEQNFRHWAATDTKRTQYESMDEKLNDLVLKNDRHGVAQMITAYLPWPAFSPSETVAWKIWLDAIENPDFKNSVVAFRGIDYQTDKVQRLKTSDGGERLAFFSTMLTQNQGNYTRRLRSLTTSRLKNADKGMAITGLFAGKISEEMKNHAKDPVASQFLSLTTDPMTAFRFAGTLKPVVEKNGVPSTKPNGGVLVVKIDKRRAIPNFASVFFESELLVPLIIFPDEVVDYEENIHRLDEPIQLGVERLIALVKAKTSLDLTTLVKNQLLMTDFLRKITVSHAETASARTCGGMF